MSVQSVDTVSVLDEPGLLQTPRAQVDIQIRVSAQMNITPFVARQKVNALLVTKVGTGLGSDDPLLVTTKGRLCWRVPVNLALPSLGRLGSVGELDVDAQTGEILASDDILKALADHADRLVAGSTS